MKRPAFLTSLLAGAGAIAILAAPVGDSNRGKTAFEKRCTGCHGLDQAKEGPALRGVYGRHPAKEPGFDYSEALKKSSVTWDTATLDRWLADTESVVPGNNMTFRLNDPSERADIVAYLKQVSGK